jgi:hypothetical protein
MTRFFANLSVLIALSSSVFAAEILVANVRLHIPPPSGYSLLASETLYAAYSRRFTPPSNEQHAVFLSGPDHAIAARGEIPQPRHWFTVQSARQANGRAVTRAEFAEIKSAVKVQIEQQVEEVKMETQRHLQKLNQGIANDTGIDLTVRQILPVSPHYETEQSLAYSTKMRYDVKATGEKPSALEVVSTTSIVNVHGTVLFLYTYADESGLQWSRSESQKWTNAILEANSPKKPAEHGEVARYDSLIRWDKVLERAAIGAIIGAVIGILTYLIKRYR